MENNLSYRNILKKAYESSRQKNPAYSIGAFGRLLGIEASRMGQILNGKVGISVKRAMSISEILRLSEYDKKIFLLLVQAEHDRNPKMRKEARDKLEKMTRAQSINREIFESVVDWRHFAVLEYLFLDDVPHDFDSMSKALNLTVDEVSSSIELLVSKNIIRIMLNEHCFKYEVAVSPSIVAELFTSEQLRSLLNETFKKFVLTKLAHGTNQFCSSVFVRFDEQQIDKVQELIIELIRKFKSESESVSQKNAIGCLAVEFFNMSES